MGVDHNILITVTIVLAALPPARQGFDTVLFIVNQDDGNSLNGSRVAEYASAAEAEAAQVAGYISATTLDFLQAAFSQQPTPASVKVAYRDVGGTETWTACLAAIEAVDTDWYGVCIYSRADAEIAAVAALIETRNKIFVAQSDDAAWLTGTPPAGLSAIVGYERTAVIYHSSDAQPADIAWLASKLVWDPDVQSAPWTGEVEDVAAISALTTAQRAFLMDTNDANVGLPFSSAEFYVAPGQMMSGRAIYEIVSADWLKARIIEAIAALKLKHDSRGEKILAAPSGQTKILAEIAGLLQQGEQVGHFTPGQTRPTAYAISSADLTARRLRFKAEAQIGADAYIFDTTVYQSSTPIQQVV